MFGDKIIKVTDDGRRTGKLKCVSSRHKQICLMARHPTIEIFYSAAYEAVFLGGDRMSQVVPRHKKNKFDVLLLLYFADGPVSAVKLWVCCTPRSPKHFISLAQRSQLLTVL